ncbi:MAG: FAD-dependent oxidoreductase [Burkholderiales bacterium]
MRVAVVGAGIIGVTSAHELAAAGHEVTVYEQGGSIAAGASFAHAGLDGAGCAVAWSPLAVAGGLFGLALRGRLPAALAMCTNPGSARWTLKWLRANRGAAQHELHHRQHRLAAYSRACTAELTQSLHLDFERSSGVTVVARSATDSQRLRCALAVLDDIGVRYKRLTADECRSLEPGLNPHAVLHGAVHLSDEGAGNSREFAHLIKQHAQRQGARFVFSAQVLAIQPGAQPELTVARGAEQQQEAFDAVVLCTGLASADLLAPLGLKLPLIGVSGLSVTAALRLDEVHPHLGPASVLLDPRRGVSIVRAGNRLRACGGAQLAGFSRTREAAAMKSLYRALNEWFPGAARTAQAQQWQGASPTLPDGLPVLGRSGLAGVWLNLGHGNVGWTVSCGSARLLSALIAGITPEINIEGLGVDRLR